MNNVWTPEPCKSCGGATGPVLSGFFTAFGWPETEHSERTIEPLCTGCRNHMQVDLVFAALFPNPDMRRWQGAES